MASEYGKKGGTSATAGKRAEKIATPDGKYSKRVFSGQRLILVQQSERYGTLVRAPMDQSELEDWAAQSVNGEWSTVYAGEAQVIA